MTAPAPQHTVSSFHDDVSPAADFLSYLGRSSARPSLYTVPYFNWKLRDNPFGGSAAYLRYRDGAAAAHCSIVAKPGNSAITGGTAVGELGDTHTHPDFQRQGHFAALGRHVIDVFNASASAGALIYGLPNQNALPGWTRSIGCAVLDALDIHEMRRVPWKQSGTLRNIVSDARAAAREYRLQKRDAAGTERAIDEVWSSAERGGWLLRKDAAWWRWRYRASPEQYETRILERDGSAVGWVTWRILRTRVPLVRRVVLCDIVATSRDGERAALALFLRREVRLLDIVEAWFQSATPSGELTGRYGFVPTRAVPVIIERNAAYDHLVAGGGWFRLSLGDTDNA
jgi:hypothetical protein